MRDQIAGIPVLVKDALTRLLGDAGRSTESGPHPVVIGATQNIVDHAVAKALHGYSLKTALEQAVHNMVLETHVLNAITTQIIESPAFTVPVAMFVKNEVKKGSLKQAKRANRYNDMVKAVEKTSRSSSRQGWSRSASPSMAISDNQKTNSGAYSD